MKKYLFLLFFLFPILVYPIADFPPPSGCANGCDQTMSSPTSDCYQCPSGGAEFLQCIGDGSATVSESF